MMHWTAINSLKSVVVFNSEIEENVTIEVGCKYVFNILNPKNKEDRLHNGKIVEILGISDNFMGDAIVRYMDSKRRGKLNPSYLLPYEIELNT